MSEMSKKEHNGLSVLVYVRLSFPNFHDMKDEMFDEKGSLIDFLIGPTIHLRLCFFFLFAFARG